MLPEATDWLAGVAAKPKSAAGGGAVATPVNALVCGEPEALSATLKVAAADPAAVGEKVMETVQEALAASDVPQVFEAIANAEALVPVRLMELMVSAALPAFASVNVCAALVLPLTAVKLAVVGVSVACGDAAAAPVQLKAMDCWTIGDGKLAPRFAESDPAEAGVQVI